MGSGGLRRVSGLTLWDLATTPTGQDHHGFASATDFALHAESISTATRLIHVVPAPCHRCVLGPRDPGAGLLAGGRCGQRGSFRPGPAIAASIIGRTALFLWTGAFFYHLLNGLRHLAWDAGWGFELPTAYRTGWTVMIGSVVLTLAAWALGYWARGNM